MHRVAVARSRCLTERRDGLPKFARRRCHLQTHHVARASTGLGRRALLKLQCNGQCAANHGYFWRETSVRQTMPTCVRERPFTRCRAIATASCRCAKTGKSPKVTGWPGPCNGHVVAPSQEIRHNVCKDPLWFTSAVFARAQRLVRLPLDKKDDEADAFREGGTARKVRCAARPSNTNSARSTASAGPSRTPYSGTAPATPYAKCTASRGRCGRGEPGHGHVLASLTILHVPPTTISKDLPLGAVYGRTRTGHVSLRITALHRRIRHTLMDAPSLRPTTARSVRCSRPRLRQAARFARRGEFSID